MPYAGIDGTFEFSLDDSTWQEVDGIDTFSFDEEVTKLMSTKYAQSGRAENSFAGLLSGKVSCSGSLEKSDTLGQTAMTTAMRAGTAIYIRYTVDGSIGDKAAAKIYSRGTSSSADGRVDVNFGIDFIGAASSIT